MHALRTDDVIAAISSPAGTSVRGILRVTGPEAVEVCARCFAARDGRVLSAQRGWRLVPGRLRLDGDATVACNAVIFRPPRSYTGQALVELHLPGSPVLLEMALRAVMAAGTRPAEPGEFTARAFLSGRMDLTAAEAVAEQIAARSDAELAAARQLGSGTLAEWTRAATDELAELLSLVEAGIDFADEPIEFVDAGTLGRRLAGLETSVSELLGRSIDMRRLQALPRVALVGPANAGKSSLMNRLTGLDRSICSPIPGTTRDVLSAVMETPAGEVLLLDGPGLGAAQGELDRTAQAAWLGLLGEVDLAIIVLPADRLYDDAFAEAADAALDSVAGRAHLLVLNKQDLLDERQRRTAVSLAATLAGDAPENAPDAALPVVTMISAATGQGCESLRQAIGSRVAGIETAGSGAVVLTARHGEALAAGLAEIRAAAAGARAGQPAELLAVHLREAMMQLGRITGVVTTEDLLERVFGRFCIGK